MARLNIADICKEVSCEGTVVMGTMYVPAVCTNHVGFFTILTAGRRRLPSGVSIVARSQRNRGFMSGSHRGLKCACGEVLRRSVGLYSIPEVSMSFLLLLILQSFEICFLVVCVCCEA